MWSYIVAALRASNAIHLPSGDQVAVGRDHAERPVHLRHAGDLAALQRHEADAVRLVDEQDAVVVRAPLQVEVEAGAAELVDRRLLAAQAVTDVKPVLAAVVAEIRDALAVVRPGRAALVDARRAGDVARVAVLAGERDDLAARLEGRPLAVGGDGRVADRAAHRLPPRQRLEPVGATADRQPPVGVGARIEQVDRAGLLVGDHPAPGVHAAQVEALERAERLDLAGPGRVAVEVHRAVAVGREVDVAVEPAGERVAGAEVGDLLGVVGLQIEDPDRRNATTAVPLPGAERVADRGVGDPLAGGVEARVCGLRNGERLGHAAADRHQEQLGDRRPRCPPAAEQDPIPVRMPVAHEVAVRVPGQAPRPPALDRDHVDVGVALVLRGIRDPASVRADAWGSLVARRARQPPRVAAGSVDDPEVLRVDEDHVIRGDGRLLEQEGLASAQLVVRRGEQDGEEGKRSDGHRALPGACGGGPNLPFSWNSR